MKNYLSKLTLLAGSFLFFAGNADAQCTATDCYIKGDFVEVGVARTGAFGGCTAPTGYHNNVGSNLGFVSDPDKDGWLVSSPGSANYMGDYFVPGSPYEGWDMNINNTNYRWRNCPSGSGCGGSACANVSYTATATQQETVWEGTVGTLDITQRTVVKKDKLYFVMYVDIVNTGATTVNGIYYFRGLDPDNDQPWAGGGFATDNTVIFQPNAISKNCLVVAKGRGYPAQAYLGLGTKDCRAKCCVFDSWPFSGSAKDVYNQNGTASSGYYFTVGTGTVNRDNAIGLTFNLGNLAAGAKTSLAYTYILKQADLDSALGETAPKFASSGTPYSAYSTFRVCPGKTVPLKVINGGQYTWIWTAGTNLTAPGGSTKIAAGGTIPITGTKVYPSGAVLGDSAVVTVWGPETFTATGISNCDTQFLIFYVDTINFSIPPAITSPIRYCEGETPVVLAAGVAAGATLNWYTVGTGGTASPTAPTPSTVFPAGSVDFDTTSYWVSQTNPAGCETPRAKINVIITKKPSLPVVENLIYCKSEPTTMLMAVGSNLKWYDAATAGTRYPTSPTPSSSTAGIFNFFVSQTVNLCESDRSQLDVEISEILASFTKSKDSLCGSELLALTNTSASSSAGNVYSSNWKYGDGITSIDSNTSHSYQDARGSYYVQLIVTNEHGCMDSTRQLVEVFPEPEMSMSASDTMICQGDAVDFVGTATPGYWSLSWDFGDGDPAFNTLQVRHAFTKSGKFNIVLNGTYPACAGIGSGVVVDVVPIPNVNLGKDSAFCPGGSVLTLGNLNPAGVDKYTWSTGDTTATIQVTHPDQYTLTAQNWKCTASDSINITKACYLDIPNVFTPGSGTDFNNYFLPRNLLGRSIITFDMKIFDRWGQNIFESNKVDGRGWDGTYKGQPMPMGVYVYQIRVSFANGINENYNGNVTLLR